MNENKKCFADADNTCIALAGKHCENCNFYRDDVYNSKIESDIRLYSSIMKFKPDRKD